MDEKVVAQYLTSLKLKTGLTFDAIAKKAERSESTVKNLCYGKVKDPRLDSVSPVVYAMGGSLDEMLNPGASTDTLKEASVFSLKEFYEAQAASEKAANEANVADIRAHYEQHVKEINEYNEKIVSLYEKRLADKDEIIKVKNETIKAKEEQISTMLRMGKALNKSRI